MPCNECEKEIENGICVRWLHDTAEDQKLLEKREFLEIIENVFNDDIFGSVLILTHDKDNETYNEYITKVFQHPTAWETKWDDMIDNTSYNIPEKQRTKYRDACIHLMAHGVTPPTIIQQRLEL